MFKSPLKTWLHPKSALLATLEHTFPQFPALHLLIGARKGSENTFPRWTELLADSLGVSSWMDSRDSLTKIEGKIPPVMEHFLHFSQRENFPLWKIHVSEGLTVCMVDVSALSGSLGESWTQISEAFDVCLFEINGANSADQCPVGAHCFASFEPISMKSNSVPTLIFADDLIQNCELFFLGIKQLLAQDPNKEKQWIYLFRPRSSSILQVKEILLESCIDRFAMLSAASGVLPIPGVDVALDLAILQKMHSFIMISMDLEVMDAESSVASSGKSQRWMAAGQKLSTVMVKQFVGSFLKNRLGAAASSKLLKVVPVVGNVAAASAGYFFTKWLGKQMLKEFKVLVEKRFRQEF
jgi:uncharacterized protein (DUF697 family)